MISMISTDLSKWTLEPANILDKEPAPSIPLPSNEPVIGVIDTLFDDSVYFHKWVENTDYLDEYELYGNENTVKLAVFIVWLSYVFIIFMVYVPGVNCVER